MKTPQKVLIVSSIVVAISLVLIFGGNYFLAITGNEFGWIPFTEQSSSLTNYSLTTDLPYTDIFINSLFWKARNIDGRGSCDLTGGDGLVTISGGGNNGGCTATFKPNLYNKHFKIDYQTSSYPSFSSCSIMGNSLSASSSGQLELSPSIINEGTSDLILNGQKIGSISSPTKEIYFTANCGGERYSTSMTLSNPRYKPLFDCAVGNDEVLIFDEFSSGSTVNINSLNYPVQKFCINQPPVIRSFSAQGIAVDTNGDILLRISEGGSFTVPSDQTLRIAYITKIQNGTLRCPASQAFNTKTKNCENILGSGMTEPTGVNVTIVNVGDNQIAYTQKSDSPILFIGDLQVSSDTPQFVCPCDNYYQSPNPKGCWQSNINGQIVTTGNSVNLNNYITVKSDIYSSVSPKFNCQVQSDDWQNVLTITINGLSISKDPNSNYTDAKDLKFNIDNEIANFDSSNSGVKLRTTYLLLDKIDESYQNLAIKKGVNSYTISLPNQILGRAIIEVIPYIKVNDKYIFGSNALTAVYNVTQTQTQIITQVQTVTITNTIYNNIWIYVLVGIVVLMAIIIVVMLRRR